MRVLIVEDEELVAGELYERLTSLRPRIDTIIARSRSSGIEALRSDEFDFIVCDLRLPPNDGGVDTDEAHGLAVHAEAKTVSPGVPCLFFTGFGTSANVREQLSAGGTQDIFGTGENYPMTRLLTKDDLLGCVERLQTFNNELTTLDSIEINLIGIIFSLDKIERRALQLLARSLGGTSVEAGDLGGLSGAQTLRVRVKDDQRRTRGSYFAKIDVRVKMNEELENYLRYVNPLLKMGSYPALGREIDAGIGKRKALFYQLADEYTESLFDVLQESESAAIAIVEVLRDIHAPWEKLCDKKEIRIRDLRTQHIDDLVFQPYRNSLDSSEQFEELKQEITTSCQHGDLHGFNILCNGSGGAVVIDFGNVGPAPSCIDPIILELSVLFHRDSPFRYNVWPTTEQAESWFNLEEYLLECPVAEFIRKCREWSCKAGIPSELPPIVYAEAVRQLKYEDTNHGRALAIARAAIRRGACEPGFSNFELCKKQNATC